MARACFNRNVLRIQTSEFDEKWKRTHLGYQGKFSQKLRHSTPRIRRSTGGQIRADVVGWYTWHDGSTGNPGKGRESQKSITNNPSFGELCESSPAVTRLTVYRRPQICRYAHIWMAGHIWSKHICGKGVLQSQRAPDPDFRI